MRKGSDDLLEICRVSGIHGITWRALKDWCECSDGKQDRCGKCHLGDFESCDYNIIAILVKKIAEANKQTDDALAQRDYWRGVADRMTKYCMET